MPDYGADLRRGVTSLYKRLVEGRRVATIHAPPRSEEVMA